MIPLVSRVSLRYRVAQRYLAARALPMGKTFQSESIRIKHMKQAILVTDLTNAGKRGKQCQHMTITLGYGSGRGDRERDEWFDEVADNMLNHAGRGFEAVKGYVQSLHDEEPYVAVEFRPLKGVDVEPYGEVFEFKIKQPNGGTIEVKSSPLEFRVTDRHWFEGPPGKDGFFQDTSFWARKKKDAMVFYGWMKENHERARRYMNMEMFRQLWAKLGVTYDSH